MVGADGLTPRRHHPPALGPPPGAPPRSSRRPAPTTVAGHRGRRRASPCPSDRRVGDGDVVEVGDCRLEVIHLVGHTPGLDRAAVRRPRRHAAPLHRATRCSPAGVGNTFGSTEDFTSLVDDVSTKIFDRLPDETWFYPGHGNDSTLGAERPHLAGVARPRLVKRPRGRRISPRCHGEVPGNYGSVILCVGYVTICRNPGRARAEPFTVRGMGKYVVTCVLALVFGFGGAFAAVAVMQDSLHGPPGRDGPHRSPRRPGRPRVLAARTVPTAGTARRASAGKAAKAADPVPVDLGVRAATGSPVQVITDVTITAGQKLMLTKRNVCVVKSARPDAAESRQSSSSPSSQSRTGKS